MDKSFTRREFTLGTTAAIGAVAATSITAKAADNDKISLRITLNQDVDFEDYKITSRISNSYRKKGW